MVRGHSKRCSCHSDEHMAHCVARRPHRRQPLLQQRGFPARCCPITMRSLERSGESGGSAQRTPSRRAERLRPQDRLPSVYRPVAPKLLLVTAKARGASASWSALLRYHPSPRCRVELINRRPDGSGGADPPRPNTRTQGRPGPPRPALTKAQARERESRASGADDQKRDRRSPHIVRP